MNKAAFLAPILYLSVTAHGGVILQNVNYDLSFSHTSSDSFSFTNTQPTSFALFDPALGTLESVEYRRSDATNFAMGYIRNNTASVASTNLRWSVTGYLTREPSWEGPRPWFGVSSGIGTTFLQPQTDWMLIGGGGIPSEGAFTQIFTGSDVDDFIGQGLFDMSPSMAVQMSGTFSGGTEFRMDVGYSSDWDIVYNYTPNTASVPEPSTLFLFVTSIAGMAWLNRRRT